MSDSDATLERLRAYLLAEWAHVYNPDRAAYGYTEGVSDGWQEAIEEIAAHMRIDLPRQKETAR